MSSKSTSDVSSNGTVIKENSKSMKNALDEVDKASLRQRLTPLEYNVTQEGATERPFTNKYNKHYEDGIYSCLVCNLQLFSGDKKFDSGSGWPSFYDVISQDAIKTREDASAIGGNLLLIVSRPQLIRTEVLCKKCDSHLGHVFKDGPKPTGLRYCINSSSLSFESTVKAGDNVDSERKIIVHKATVNGCGGNASCSLTSGCASNGSVEDSS